VVALRSSRRDFRARWGGREGQGRGRAASHSRQRLQPDSAGAEPAANGSSGAEGCTGAGCGAEELAQLRSEREGLEEMLSQVQGERRKGAQQLESLTKELATALQQAEEGMITSLSVHGAHVLHRHMMQCTKQQMNSRVSKEEPAVAGV